MILPIRSQRLTEPRRSRASAAAGTAAMACLLASLGCEKKTAEVVESSPYPPGFALAVAPALNFSGSSNVDPVRVADTFASELGSTPGLNIIPVNRVMAILAREGKWQIESPAHAVRVARQLGCDAIIVPALTDYEPYTPIVVGLAAQLYVVPEADPGRAGATLANNPANSAPDVANALAPRAQVQTVYNASHADLADRVKKYGKVRDADKSPYAWRRYMLSQELFLRFCCYDSGNRLMEQERQRVSVAAAGEPE